MWKSLGSSGPGGMKLEALHGWLLKFREDIKILCTSVETFSDWLANGIPPWAAYHEFMSGCLIALKKQPRVHPVRVGEALRPFFSKIVLKVTWTEATSACQYDQMCARLVAGIDGTVHVVKNIWDINLTTEDWKFLRGNTKNAFNNITRIVMLWKVQHFWPSGVHVIFNCYCHWSSHVLRNRNGMTVFLHNREGVT